MNHSEESRPFPYAIAVFVVLLATLLTPILGLFFPFDQVVRSPQISLFFAAVAVSTWWGGLRTGILTIILSSILIEFVLVPLSGIPSWNYNAVFRIGTFLVVAGIINSLYAARQRAEKALAERADIARMESDISSALIQTQPLPEILRECAPIIVHRLRIRAAAIWLIEDVPDVATLVALSLRQRPTSVPHPVWDRFSRFFSRQPTTPTAPTVIRFDLRLEERTLGVIVLCSEEALSNHIVRSLNQASHDISQAIGRWRAAQVLEAQSSALAAALDKAEQEAQARLDLIGSFSHEVRNPMSGILGLTRMLLETELSPEQRKIVQSVQDSGQTLLAVINGVLDLARLKDGQFTLDQKPLDLREIVEQTVEMMAANAYEKRIGLFARYDPEMPRRFLGDALRIRQILLNLLSNAIKFTHQGHVFLDVDCGDRDAAMPMIYITVHDTGMGIAENRIAGIFDRYNQSNRAMAQRYGGAGLGLSICKQLAELMGGTISVQSKVGNGSTFAVKVPLMQDRQADPDHPLALPKKFSLHSALLLEEESINRQILAEQLGAWGMSVSAFASVEAADEALSDEAPRFDVVLTDRPLPEGWHVQAKPGGDGKPLPLRILLGSIAQVQQLTREVKAGNYNAVLTKPIRSSQLLDVLTTGLFPEDTETQPQREPGQRSGAEEPLRGRVLIVEDNRVNQHMARWELEKLGCETEAVESGVAALEILERRSFDLVLMDCQMPEMDGYETTREIRRREQEGSLRYGKRLPIIAVTADLMPGTRERCIAVGMDDFMGKPLESDRLVRILARFLQHRDPRANEVQGATGANEKGDARPISDRSAESRLVELFEAEYPRLVERLQRAAEAGACEELAKTAHSIKGIGMYLHAEPVIQAAIRLEQAARSPSGQRPDKEVVAMEEELNRLASGIRTVGAGSAIK